MNNFDQAPLLVIWEVTQACDLACIHCRASVAPGRHPAELNTEEGHRLLDEIRKFGKPLLVFTGGDPLKRPDLFPLIEHSVSLGLRTNVGPSATPLLTKKVIEQFKQAGIARMAVSIDGPDAASHDRFRGVEETFKRASMALREARDIGLDTEVQTTVTRRNFHRLYEIASLCEDWETRMWSVFFIAVTGRALADNDLTGEEYERVFADLYDISKRSTFAVKTTEAMHYRRFQATHLQHEPVFANPESPGFTTASVSDGRGFVFISHTGEIYPSGFLPLHAGNVRTDSLVDVYRNSPLFLTLRDADARHGKCGACEYRKLCGGSRARAFATTGDYLAEDPRCIYQPALAAVRTTSLHV